MRLLLIGRRRGVTHWLEDAAQAWRGNGHQLMVAHVRDPRLPQAAEAALFSERLGAPRAEAIARAARRFAPELIVVIGAFHCPASVLERLAAAPGRPPLVGWAGDLFEGAARPLANLYDLIGYTDSGLLARHRHLGFGPPAVFLPHAVEGAAAASGPPAGPRDPRLLFIANPTDHRRAVVRSVRRTVVIHGPGWTTADGAAHEIHPRRLPANQLGGLYGRHRAVLNARNELHVLVGLNQRSFAPCVTGAAVVADDQPDLALCFEPGREVFVWRDTDELNAIASRVADDPAGVASVGAAGRRRVLADHTFSHRLAAISAAL